MKSQMIKYLYVEAGKLPLVKESTLEKFKQTYDKWTNIHKDLGVDGDVGDLQYYGSPELCNKEEYPNRLCYGYLHKDMKCGDITSKYFVIFNMHDDTPYSLSEEQIRYFKRVHGRKGIEEAAKIHGIYEKNKTDVIIYRNTVDNLTEADKELWKCGILKITSDEDASRPEHRYLIADEYISGSSPEETKVERKSIIGWLVFDDMLETGFFTVNKERPDGIVFIDSQTIIALNAKFKELGYKEKYFPTGSLKI